MFGAPTVAELERPEYAAHCGRAGTTSRPGDDATREVIRVTRLPRRFVPAVADRLRCGLLVPRRGFPSVMTQTHADYRLSQLDQLEAESIHIFREVAAEFEKPVLMFSGGKDSIVMLRLAEKAFYPAKIPFPVLQVDTGLRLPRGARDPRQLGQPPRRPPRGRQHRRRDRQRRRRRRRQDQPQPHADRHPAQRDRGERLHRRLRWRPPRRGEGPRQGARLLPPRRVRPVGPEDAAPRAVEPLQRPPPRGRAHADLPDLQLDRAGHLGLHRPRGHRDPRHLLLPPAPRLRARRHAAERDAAQPAARRRGRRGAHRPVPHRRRHHPHRLRRVHRLHHRRDHRRDRRRPLTERGATRGDDRFSEAAMEDRKKEGYF